MANTPRSSQAPVLLTKAAILILPLLFILPIAVYAQISHSPFPKDTQVSQTPHLDAKLKVPPPSGSGTAIPADLLETAVSGSVVDPNLSGDPGAFTYQYPITIPPGRNGMAPSLSLTYSSNSHEDSGFGYGWGISIPYIERYNKLGENNLYSISSPSNTFYSSISGELVASSTANNYLARNDDGSYTQYSFSGNSWTVTDRSGNIYLFGMSSSTRQDDPGGTGNTFKWMLQKETDPNGNYVLYTYTKDLGQIYPSVISYTNSTTGAGAGIFSVNFTLGSNASSTATSTTDGFPVHTRYRVTQLAIQVSSTTASTYTLNYSHGDNGSRSILASVTQAGTNTSGTLTLPATTFSYSTSSPASSMATSTWAIPTGFFVNHGSPGSYSYGDDFADINGDGLMDIIQSFHDYGSNSNYQFIYQNTGNGWSTASSTYTPPCWFETVSNTGSFQDGGGRLVDINGDGLPDFICGETAYINNGTNWVASSTWNTPVYVNNGTLDGGIRFADINGDGLPDIIDAILDAYTNTYYDAVYLNNGNGWISDPSWVFPTNFAFSDSYGDDAYGRVFDVNGDGLADLIISDTVYINTGHGWTFDPVWTFPASVDSERASFAPIDVNNDGLVDLTETVGALTVPTDPNTFYWSENQTFLNTGSGWATSTTEQLPVAAYFSAGAYAGETGLHTGNMSGAGLPDLIENAGFGAVGYGHVMFAKGMQPDLLVHVAESAGKGITVNYKSSSAYGDVHGNRLSPHLPFYFPTVQSISYNDDVTSTSTESYVYTNGTFYAASATDRRFAGFGSITKTDESGNVSINYYHTGVGTSTSLGEYNDNQSKIGKIYRTEYYDGTQKLFKILVTKWDGLVNGLANFVWPTVKTELEYDGLSTHNDLASSLSYSPTGDLLQQTSWGAVTANNDGSFTDTGPDALTTTITYAASSTIPFDKPSEKTIVNQSSATLSDIKYYYDSNTTLGLISKGNLTQQQTLASSTATTTNVIIKKTYNAYGMVTKDITPLNASSTYLFDSHKMYDSTVTNALSQITSYVYNYFIGKPTQVTDPNGEVTLTNYDALNRISSILKPDPIATSTLATTTAYAYTTSTYPQLVQEIDYLTAASTTNKYTYTDGFGRTVEERSPSATSNTYSVTDTYYNGLGLVSSKSLPYFGTGTSFTGISLPPVSTLITTYLYDPLQRVLSTTNSVGSTINTYGNGEVTTKDPNGNFKDYYKDAFGNLINVVEHNKTTIATTTYVYDGNNNLTQLTDASGNVRNVTYDLLGRRLTSQDLHASSDSTFGRWSYVYDKDGNVTQQTDPKNQVVNYTYDGLDRVLTENYTGTSGSEQNYTYDTCSEGIGHLCTASSTSSVTNYLYNILGNTIKETDQIATSSYITQHTYDRLGNVTGITYPDNSQVTYIYNLAGLLGSVGQKQPGASNFSSVVTHIDYTPTNKIADEIFGNGVVTTNTYDATKLYRLIRVQTIAASGPGTLIQTGGGPVIGQDVPNSSDAPDASPVVSFLSSPLNFYADDLIPDSFEMDTTTIATSSPILLVPSNSNESSTTPSDTATTTDPIIGTSTPVQIGSATTTPIISGGLSTSTNPTPIASTSPATSTPDKVSTTTPNALPSTLKAPVSDLLGDMQMPDGTIKYAYNTHVSIDSLPPSAATLSEAKKQGLTIKNEVLAKRSIHTRVFATDKPKVYVADIVSGDPLYYKDPNGNWWVAAYATTTKDIYDAQTQPQDVSLVDKIINFFLPAKASAASSTFYPDPYPETNTVDGDIYKDDSLDWPTTRNAPYGDVAQYNFSGNGVGDGINGYSYYDITRSIILFDTSSLSGAGTISGANLNLYITYEISGNGPGAAGFYISSSTPGGTTYLTTGDYSEIGSTSFGYNGGPFPWDIYVSTPLNSDGIAGISKTGTTKLGLRTYNDMNNVAPQSSAQFDLAFGSAESGLSEAPELTVTFTYNPTGPNSLLTDGQTNPANLGDHAPSFAAIFNSLNPSDYATDYQLQVSTSSTDFSTPVWDTSEASITASTTNGTYAPIISYAGSALNSLTNYFWRIRFWDSFNNIGVWSSELASFSISPSSPPSAPTNLKVNGATNPSNLATSTPSFTATYNQNYATTSVAVDYEIQVSASSTSWSYLQWDSNEQPMASTTIGSSNPAISYGGGGLVPSTTYYWRIRFWNNYGFQGLWSTATSSFSVSTSIATPDLQDIYYTYDPDGNITQINDYSGTGAGKVEKFSYDGLNRLLSAATTAASSSPFSQTYSYSPTGNLTYKSDVGNYSYAQTGNDDADAPTTIGSSTLAYDNNGNLTSYGPSSYTWDYRNELTGIGNVTATSTYAYDYQSNRDQKTTGGVTTYYPNNLYNISGSAIVQNVYDTTGNLIATTQGGGGGVLATSTPTLNTTATSSSNGYDGGPSTKTWTHVVGSGANRILVLVASILQDDTGAITSATYNGLTLTKAVNNTNAKTACEIWYLVNPPTGSHTMSVTITGGTDTIKLDSSDYTGINQTTPIDKTQTATGTTGNPSISINAPNAKDVVEATFSRYNTIDANTNRTKIYKDWNGTIFGAASYQIVSSPGTASDTYTGTDTDNWCMNAVALRPATSGGIATTTTYIHPDYLGSTNVTSDTSGNLAQTLDYYPFGSSRLNTGTPTQARTFIGQQYDNESNLSYLQARYYNGSQGQFLSEDPVFLGSPSQQNLQDPQSLNSYSYSEDNPITKKDPTGKSALILEAPLLIALIAAYIALLSLYSPPAQQAMHQMAYNTVQAFQSAGVSDGHLGSSTGGLSSPSYTSPYSTPSTVGVPTYTQSPGSNINFAKNSLGGDTSIKEEGGGYPKAQQDFWDLNPTNVKTYENGTTAGQLEDGSRVNVRPQSSDGRPTLEVQKPNGDVEKTRYND